MIYRELTFLLLCLVIAVPTIAGVYRWEDPPGKINFSNVPPEPIENYPFGKWSSEFAKQKQEQKEKNEEAAKKKVQAEELAKAKKQNELAAKIAKVRRPGSGNDMSAEEDENENQELTAADVEKIELDRCGVFKAYAQEYRDKLTRGCVSKVCKIYARQLLKYKTKVKQYCK